MEAVGHAGTCMGILGKDGIVLCAEKKNQHKLLDINSLVARVDKLKQNSRKFLEILENVRKF